MLRKLTAKKLTHYEAKHILDSIIIDFNRMDISSKVYLFGSALENKMTTASDVDLLLTFENLKTLKEGRKKCAGLSARVGWPVECLFYLEEEFIKRSTIGGVCMIAKEDGRLIYDGTQK